MENLTPSKLDILLSKSVEKLCTYIQSFKSHFTSSTRSSAQTAQSYIEGLFKTEKKQGTCTGISEVLPFVGSQNLNHLLSDSVWSYKSVMRGVSRRSNTRLSKHKDSCLHIDEYSFPKKGDKSVGVAHQYLGCLGKCANGQVVVGLVQNNSKYSSLINSRLYLPKSWIEDEQRMDKAGVPLEHQRYQTKLEIALDLLDTAIEDELDFNWVNVDSLYGRSLLFLSALESRRLTFVADIPKDSQVYEQPPQLYVPPKKVGRGRPPSRLVTDTPSNTVQTLANQLKETDWTLLAVREGTKGPVIVRAYKKRIWVWDKDKPYTQSFILYIKKPVNYDDKDKITYSLVNIGDEVPLKRIAFMQGQRFFVEHTYKEGKNQVGLGDYQVRSWNGLHRHLALCMMALNFLMEIKMEAKTKGMPHLSARDIRRLIEFILPNKINSIEQLIQSIKYKHDNYQNQIQRNHQKAQVQFPQLE